MWVRGHSRSLKVHLNSTMRLISGTLRSTSFPWLPVLSNFEPPALYEGSCHWQLVEKIFKHDSWPIQPDILNPGSRCGWTCNQLKSKVDGGITGSRLRWSILTYVCEFTIRQPDFHLPRQQWSLLNRFRAEQGHCGACRRKWRLTDTDLCLCGETQTMFHIV